MSDKDFLPGEYEGGDANSWALGPEWDGYPNA